MNEVWRWVPGKSIGPFTFGERADPYIEDYDLQKRKPDCAIADWDIYEFPGFESWIVVEEGRIIEVHCVDKVEYNDRDLIGMLSSDVRDLLGAENKKEEGVGFGYALHYYEMGLTLFVENDVVTAAACGLVLPEGDDSGAVNISKPVDL